MYKIEKNIAYPGSKKANRYPFAQMKVGDSFVIERKNRTHASAHAHYWVKKNNPNAKFSIRTLAGVSRMWRVK